MDTPGIALCSYVTPANIHDTQDARRLYLQYRTMRRMV
ncbi:MAG: hypothetical protein OJF49_003568 [Ktedonobacterales bacterium]|nr:MAG: hypothetical protein OJF49_003568 [Ktedonobacterales bacterium]